MKRSLLLLSLLCGCHDSTLSNDEIILEVEKCHDAGLQVYEITGGLSYKTIAIICTTNGAK